MSYTYRIKVETQEGSELYNKGIKRTWLLNAFTSKKSAEEFAEKLSKTGIKVLEITRERR